MRLLAKEDTMPSSIFSTYSVGENRVTASILAVLKSLSLGRMERILGALLEQSEFVLVSFQNQPSKGKKSVPDGEILSSCRILIETKIKRNTVRAQQLQYHLSQLDGSGEAVQVLLVITPDQSRPAAFEKLIDPNGRTAWTSFAALDQAIDEVLGDDSEVVSEREAFLLRELQTMLAEEHLIGSESDVVVVAARHAWPEYERCHAYVCQPKRAFKPVRRIAFYSEGHVYPLVPLILEVHDEIVLDRNQHNGRLGEIVHQLIDDIPRSKKEVGHSYKFFLLSAPDADSTIKLEMPIPNDIHSKTGQPTAFTMGQRYVTIDKLLKAKTTSDLA
jgi:hypothetical protein